MLSRLTSPRSILIVLLVLASSLVAGKLPADQPAGSLRAALTQGKSQYERGNYADALRTFESAAAAAPDSELAKYDQACAAASAGEFATAKPLFSELSTSSDIQLAAGALFHLGSLAANEAETAIGESPEQTPPDQRSVVVALLQSADGYYRNCLSLDPNATDARQNLETVRQYLAEVQSIWQELERREKLSQQELYQLLESIEQEQFILSDDCREMQRRPPARGSRLHRQPLVAAQEQLQRQLDGVREKIVQQLQPSSPPATPGQAPTTQDPQSQEAMEQALAAVQSIVDRSSQSMSSSAGAIESARWTNAAKHQIAAVDRLREVDLLLAPFDRTLLRAIDDQEKLLAQSQQPTDSSSAATWRQSWITKSAAMLSQKAAVELQSLPAAEPPESSPETTPAAPENNSNDQADSIGGSVAPDSDEIADQPKSAPAAVAVDSNTNPTPLDAQQQLRKALEKAIELAPQIVSHSEEAERLLPDAAASARDEQTEVLNLLREIADLLPKQGNSKSDQSNQSSDQQKSPEQDQNNSSSEQQSSQSDSQQDQSSSDRDQSQPSSDAQPKSEDSHQNSSDTDKQDSQQPKAQANEPNPNEPASEPTDSGAQPQPNPPNEKQDEKQDATADDQQSDGANAESPQEAEVKNQPLTDEERQQMRQARLAEERAQSMLQRIREREAKYRALLQQLRQLQSQRNPVDKDW